MKQDFELFVGPFSAHAYSITDLMDLINVAHKLGFLNSEDSEHAYRMAANLVTNPDKSTMYACSNFSIHNRAKEQEIKEKATARWEERKQRLAAAEHCEMELNGEM